MSSGTSVSPHGFVAGRGRGYRPEQVDALAAELSRARDDARERAARLTVRVEELEAEAQRLRLAVTRLAPQTYESLGDRAREILALAEEEAAGVRASAADDVRRITQDAEAARGRRARRPAPRPTPYWPRPSSGPTSGWSPTGPTADGVRIAAARDEAKERREEALAALRRGAASGRRRLLAEQEKDHAERLGARPSGRSAGQEAAADARDAERAARAEGSCPRRDGRSPRRRSRPGTARRTPRPAPPNSSRRPACTRTACAARRNGCCASTARVGRGPRPHGPRPQHPGRAHGP